jgi:poly(3-hydroxybutyrate) depolymerase
MRFALALAAACLVAACVPKEEPEAYRGPSYRIDTDRISVSGISAGAYMAGQFHVAHSSLVKGVGIIAGGPYFCARNSLRTALGNCVKDGAPETAVLGEEAAEFAATGRIDSLDNLDGAPVWLFHSPIDAAVGRVQVDAAAEQYRNFGAAVVLVDTIEAAHGVPTLATGAACDSFESPYLNACEFDAAGEILAAIYGPLDDRGDASGNLIEVDLPGAADAGLLDTAFLYVPADCSGETACGVHVFFHGCQMSSELVGDAVLRGAGFNEWAETNRLLVLYPQVKSSKLAPMNPMGCFDWWGYTSEGYATKTGPQLVVIKSLLDALAGKTL